MSLELRGILGFVLVPVGVVVELGVLLCLVLCGCLGGWCR